MVFSSDSPFNLSNLDGFKRWFEDKLDKYPQKLENISIDIDNPLQLTNSEKNRIIELVNKTGIVHYRLKENIQPDILKQFAAGLGVVHLDENPHSDESVSIITDKTDETEKKAGEYIPYTPNRIQWHTDGYYNPPEKQIYSFVLHCYRPALTGGENDLIDNEIIYGMLRNEDPEIIRALMQPDAMTIPANDDKDVTTRPDSVGPVFLSRPDGSLHMRYTARKRHIIWKDEIRWAVEKLEEKMESLNEFYFSGKLSAGEGIISANSLHRRHGYHDDPENKRIYFRARCYDIITTRPGK